MNNHKINPIVYLTTEWINKHVIQLAFCGQSIIAAFDFTLNREPESSLFNHKLTGVYTLN